MDTRSKQQKRQIRSKGFPVKQGYKWEMAIMPVNILSKKFQKEVRQKYGDDFICVVIKNTGEYFPFYGVEEVKC